MRRVRLRGCDDLTNFMISRGTCDVCGKRRVICVTYVRHGFDPTGIHSDELLNTPVYKMLTWVDILKHTILRAAYYSTGRGRLGIQCGCYGKFHRQLAHIASSIEHKPGYKPPAEVKANQ